MTSEISVAQLQGITPTNEITLASDTKLYIDGVLRTNSIQNSSGLTVLTSTTDGNVTVINNISTTNNITGSIISPGSRLVLPNWTTATRPSTSLSSSTMGYNTTTSIVEIWNGSSWTNLNSAFGTSTPTKDILNVFGDGSCLACWRFDNNVTDLSGNYNGNSSNVSFTDSTGGKFGQSAIFNGSSSTVSIPNVKNSYPFSISMWATHNLGWNLPGNGMDELFNASIGGQRVSMGIVQNPGWRSGPTLMYGGTSHWSCSNSYFLNDNVDFYHLVFIVHGSNDSNHRIYINGVRQELINNGGGHGGSAGWNIGSNSSGGEWWRGKIDQVRFFNRVITESEVLTLFAES